MAKLEIEIGAITSGLAKGLKDAESKLQSFGKQAQDIGTSLSKNISAPIAAIGTAAFASSVKLGNFADTLLDLEQQTGLSTDSLQKYRSVTREAGIATDAVAKASENLQRRLASGEEGSADLTAGLNALGISARDASGNLRSIDTVLEETIKQLADIEDITERNQLAIKIFGRSASELAPLLALGSQGIEEATQKAEKLGLVLGRDTLEAANQFRIQVDTLTASFGGIANEIGEAFLPIASALVDIVQNNVIPAIRGVISFFNELSPTVKTVIAVVGGLVAAIGPLLTGLGFFVTTILPALKVGLGAVTVLFSPLALKIAAITAAVVGLGLVVKGLIDSWDTVGAFFSQLWDKIKLLFINGVKNTLSAFNKFTSIIGIDFQETIDSLDENAKRIKTALDAEPVVTLGDVFSDIGSSIKNTFTSVKDTIVNAMGESEQAITKTAVAFQGLGGGGISRTQETAISGGQNRGDFGGLPNLTENLDISLGLVQTFGETVEETFEKVKFNITDLSGAFTGIGNLIGSTFNNLPLGSFVGQFAKFVTEIVAGAFAVSKANAVAGATQSSLFSGPAAAFTLPAFIASAVGLISSAFSGLGNFGGRTAGGGGSAGVGSGIGDTFGGGATGFSPFAGDREIKLVAETDGAKLRYVIDQSNAYQN